MGVRVVRLVAALALMGSGALMYAASWQRWAEACLWWEVQGSTPFCWVVQDHKYDFVVPSDPWTPIGTAAEQAGLSLLILAAALALMPWALTGRRPGPFSALTLVVCVVSVGVIGRTTVRSGLAGEALPVPFEGLTVRVYFLVVAILLVRLTWAARGWSRAAGILLVLAMPFPGILIYGIGPYDANPWYEGFSGILSALAGACLVVAAFRKHRPLVEESSAEVAAPATR